MDIDADIAACADLVARGDPPRFRATMAAPVALRPMLFPLYAFNLEVARAPWVTQEPMIALMRLQWWRDALEEIASGAVVRRHEVVTPLAAALDAQAARALDDLVAAREADVQAEAPADLDTLGRYVDRTAGTLLWTAARLAGAPDEATARDAGLAQGIAGYLEAVPALVAKGRHPLPHGDPADHAERLAAQALEALARFRAARVPAAARPVFLVLPEAESILRRIAAEPGRVLDPPPPEPGLKTRLALGLRAALGKP
ncbi:squalene/phytoene synthase family protein [Jannaschia aquimarina]|uniref:Squalene/phytoene synthase n=1 Tax=Jannaschia aquimarina TaxID=935700 RepID=A0A0D1D5E6_9RHOB|nr:squalene/phytoene synthase family protein [Jannaschia aquimarina]KIT15203.1 Squalene/phytoene synthase [Jannaschia aquimarina]SNT32963.1 Phytoene/squalene synthetase [Jannaschia aquimarina]